MALQLAENKRVNEASQSLWALVPLIVAALVISYMRMFNNEASMTATAGFAFGYVMQRSRFCFAAGFRDPFMIRNTALTRVILLLLLLTSLGFAIVHGIKGGLPEGGIIYPVGIHTAVGGILFGFGLVIAGNCVSGGLMRMGEGYIMQWYTFAGLLIGSALGAWNLGWWGPMFIERAPIIFIPDVFGWALSLATYIAVLSLLYLAAIWYERGSLKQTRQLSLSFSGVLRSVWDSFQAVFSSRNWSYALGAVFLAIINILLFLTWGKPAGITSGLTHLAGWLSCRIGFLPCDWYYFEELIYLESRRIYLEHPFLFLSIFIVIGSFFASLMHNEFKIRKPKSNKFILSALVGGTLLGYSARVAMGCNIGGFWGGISSFSLHGWVFGLFILVGAFIGGKFFMRFLV